MSVNNISVNNISVNGNLVMGPTKNITLQPSAGYVAPVSGQLGYITTVSIANGTTLANTTVSNLTQWTVDSSGIYYVSYFISVINNGTITTSLAQAWIQNNAGGQYYGLFANNATQNITNDNSTGWISLNGTAIMQLKASDSIALKYLIGGANNKTCNLSYLQFVRIA
jgi:hypothetical protein